MYCTAIQNITWNILGANNCLTCGNFDSETLSFCECCKFLDLRKFLEFDACMIDKVYWNQNIWTHLAPCCLRFLTQQLRSSPIHQVESLSYSSSSISTLNSFPIIFLLSVYTQRCFCLGSILSFSFFLSCNFSSKRARLFSIFSRWYCCTSKWC